MALENETLPSIDVLSSDDVVMALRSPDLVPATPLDSEIEASVSPVPVLIRLSGRDHLIRRRAIALPFSSPLIAEWEPMILAVCDDVTTTLPTGRIDLAETFAWPVVTRAAAGFLGLSVKECFELMQLGRGVVDLTTSSARRRLTGIRLYRALSRTVEQWRPDYACTPRKTPTPLLGYLPDSKIGTADLLGATITMLGGAATVAVKGILSTIRAVAEREAAHPGTSPTVGVQRRREQSPQVDDLLSQCPIVRTLSRRVAVEGFLFAGVHLRAGQLLTVHIIGNGDRPNYPFGFGPHYCLGAAWSRLLCQTALHSLFRDRSVKIVQWETGDRGLTSRLESLPIPRVVADNFERPMPARGWWIDSETGSMEHD